ncbi:MAG: prolyl aminopeptidase [Pseudomonadales bacterium]
MLPLYPDIKPYARHMIKVDSPHELYVDESGTPEGIPVLFVHGGPGSGCEFDSRRFFNPEKYRIILFDQRGAGRSTPHGELTNNTTPWLVADMDRIREELGVDKWILFGGGWGSTLSLVYAETWPDRVMGLVLRGVFLGRSEDVNWFYQEGASRIFPDHWEEFIEPIEEEDRTDFPAAYHKLMSGADELARMGAAKAWSRWEAHCASLHPSHRLINHFTDPHRALARCKIGAWYFANNCFLEPNQILSNASVLASIPGTIIHGRFDMVCPFENAHALHKLWPVSQLYIVREAGHAATEPSLIDALIRSTRDMALRFESEFGV